MTGITCLFGVRLITFVTECLGVEKQFSSDVLVFCCLILGLRIEMLDCSY